MINPNSHTINQQIKALYIYKNVRMYVQACKRQIFHVLNEKEKNNNNKDMLHISPIYIYI